MRRPQPTLKDIAAELNLSHPTVSRALSGHPSISAETKARVREAADRLGYVVNSGARMLKRGHGNVVGLLLPDITNEFYAAVAKKLSDDCSERHQQLILSVSGDDADRELALVRALLEARPTAIVVALTRKPHPETVSLLNTVHCVQFMQTHPGLAGPRVTVRASGGARLAIEHLLSLGHRQIGFIGPTLDYAIGQARMEGVTAAMKAAGLAVDPACVRLGPSDGEFAFDAVLELLAVKPRPTALYLSSAPISVAAMRALTREGITIPAQLSVVVAGVSPWHEAWPGGLTSITLPVRDLAEAASRYVAEAGDGEASEGETVLSFELVPRGSTAAIAGNDK